MITRNNNLIYDIAGNLRVSEKFTNVQKIIYCSGAHYILDSGYIYCNDNKLRDDQCTMINYKNVDISVKFIDIEPDTRNLFFYAVGSDYKLYTVSNNTLELFDHNNFVCTFNITNAFSSSYINIFVLKSDANDYYQMCDDYTLKYLGNFDKIHFVIGSIVLIKDNNIQLINCVMDDIIVTVLENNIDVLRMSPEGSQLRFATGDCNKIINITQVPLNIADRVIIRANLGRTIYICFLTGNVYRFSTDSTIRSIIIKEIIELRCCVTNKLNEINKYMTTKNANNIFIY